MRLNDAMQLHVSSEHVGDDGGQIALKNVVRKRFFQILQRQTVVLFCALALPRSGPKYSCFLVPGFARIWSNRSCFLCCAFARVWHNNVFFLCCVCDVICEG